MKSRVIARGRRDRPGCRIPVRLARQGGLGDRLAAAAPRRRSGAGGPRRPAAGDDPLDDGRRIGVRPPRGFVDWRTVRWTVAVGVPATIVGAIATRWIDGSSLIHTLATLGSPQHGTYLAYAWNSRIMQQLMFREPADAGAGQSVENCRTRFLCYWSDIDQPMFPQRSAALEHPDLNVTNVEMHGVGHMSLPIYPWCTGSGPRWPTWTPTAARWRRARRRSPGAAEAADRPGRRVRQRAWSQADPTLARAGRAEIGCHPRRCPQLRRTPPHSSDCSVPSDGDRPCSTRVRVPSAPSPNLWRWIWDNEMVTLG